MAVEGVMARRVADVRLGLATVCGMSARDPESVPVPLAVERSGSRRVALVAEPPGGETHPEIAAAVRWAGRALADAGYQVSEAVPLSHDEVLMIWASGCSATSARRTSCSGRSWARTRSRSLMPVARCTRRSTPTGS
jgi:amidase